MLTLHHLEASRSSRILWLLEALRLEYELVTHKRGPDLRASADLKQVHPLGKAPILVDGDLVLVESATILRYISDKYGDGAFLPPAGSAARAIHDERLDYAESSLMTPLMIKLMGRGSLPDVLDQFATRELDRALTYLGDSVGEGPFLMGQDLTLADMQMSYCLAVLETGRQLVERRTLQAYCQRIQAHPGFQRALEIGGPLLPSTR